SNQSVQRRQRRLVRLQCLGAFVGSFPLAAKNECDASFGVELDDHVRTFVPDPDVVVLVDFYRVGKGPCVELMANLAYKFSVWGELEQLCGGRCVGRSHCAAAGKYENVPFRIYRRAGGFAERNIGRRLSNIVDELETD